MAENSQKQQNQEEKKKKRERFGFEQIMTFRDDTRTVANEPSSKLDHFIHENNESPPNFTRQPLKPRAGCSHAHLDHNLGVLHSPQDRPRFRAYNAWSTTSRSDCKSVNACLLAVLYVEPPLFLTQPRRVVPLVRYQRTSVHLQDPTGDVIQEISGEGEAKGRTRKGALIIDV